MSTKMSTIINGNELMQYIIINKEIILDQKRFLYKKRENKKKFMKDKSKLISSFCKTINKF